MNLSDSSTCALAARQLGEIVAQLSGDGEQRWADVEAAAQTLANGLRVRDEVNHTALGRTTLPQTLTTLLKDALKDSDITSLPHPAAIFELLRIGANLCMDHDENRGHLLEAGFPQEVVSLLEAYAGTIPKDSNSSRDLLPLSIPHMKIVKTSIGVLLNATIGYEPVRSRLTSLEAGMTLLRLSVAIYPPGSWVKAAKSTEEDAAESWILRSGISNWAWRAIEELKDDSQPFLGPDALPYLTPSLLAFVPPYPSPPTGFLFSEPSSTRSALVRTDFDVLEESCTLLESLSLDVEDVRLSLARGVPFPAEHNGVPCLSNILDFIERGDYSPLWSSSLEPGSSAQMAKKFDICKAALIKAIVEVAGEDKNEDVLWDDTEADQPGGVFVCRMISWIREYDKVGEAGRGDLVICASLSLGNLARRETTSTALLSPPHSIAPILSVDALLSPKTDIKVKHGVVGLLKHLAQSSANSPANRSALSGSGIVRRLVTSKIWNEKGDAMVEVVQMSAIGVVKHLCNGSVRDACDLVLPAEDSSTQAGLSQIVALVRRSDTVAIKSEGTRVVVNVVKSLWSANGASSDAEEQQRRETALKAVLVPASAEVLASLIDRSMRYPLLVNEGVVSLSLLSAHDSGGNLVLDAILAPLPAEVTPNSASVSASNGSDIDSPVMTPPPAQSRLPVPRRALDRLIAVLKNSPVSDSSTNSNHPNPATFPMEVRANVCALLAQVSRKASAGQLEAVRDPTKNILEDLAKSAGPGRDGLLGIAAKKALESFGAPRAN